MRTSLILALLCLAARGAWACPELSGEFVCADVDGDVKLTVSQGEVDGYTVYRLLEDDGESMDVTELIADNQRRENRDDESMMWEQTRCESDALVVEFGGEDFSSGMTMTGTLTFSLNARGDLSQRAVGSFSFAGQETPFDEQMICSRH